MVAGVDDVSGFVKPKLAHDLGDLADVLVEKTDQSEVAGQSAMHVSGTLKVVVVAEAVAVVV